MKTIAKPSQSELSIKKSKFIARLFPTSTKRESKEIIEKISAEFSDATHNCTAYITNDGEGYDDNGEPSGTAGKPMLNALRKNDIQNVTAIVTRYFGGVKLGAGGLVRAYGKSVLEALENSEIIEIDYYDVYSIEFDYVDMKTVENEIRKTNLKTVNKSFDQKVVYHLISPEKIAVENVFDKFKNKVFLKFEEKQAFRKSDF